MFFNFFHLNYVLVYKEILTKIFILLKSYDMYINREIITVVLIYIKMIINLRFHMFPIEVFIPFQTYIFEIKSIFVKFPK